MTIKVEIQMTFQGLLIPYAVVADWQNVPLEMTREEQQVIIRPKPSPATTRAQVQNLLREAGMLYEVKRPAAPVISEAERARLADKLSQSSPLSEVIIEEREDRV